MSESSSPTDKLDERFMEMVRYGAEAIPQKLLMQYEARELTAEILRRAFRAPLFQSSTASFKRYDITAHREYENGEEWAALVVEESSTGLWVRWGDVESVAPSATASASPRVKCDYPRCGKEKSRCGVCDYQGGQHGL